MVYRRLKGNGYRVVPNLEKGLWLNSRPPLKLLRYIQLSSFSLNSYYYNHQEKSEHIELKKYGNKMAASVANLFSLSGRTAVVTGGTRGIGQAMAIALAEAGADIVLIQVCRFRASIYLATDNS